MSSKVPELITKLVTLMTSEEEKDILNKFLSAGEINEHQLQGLLDLLQLMSSSQQDSPAVLSSTIQDEDSS